MTPEEKKAIASARLEVLLAKTDLTPEEEAELAALQAEEVAPLDKTEEPSV